MPRRRSASTTGGARSMNALVSSTAWALASRNTVLISTSVDCRALRCASHVTIAPVSSTSPQTLQTSFVRKLNSRVFELSEPDASMVTTAYPQYSALANVVLWHTREQHMLAVPLMSHSDVE